LGRVKGKVEVRRRAPSRRRVVRGRGDGLINIHKKGKGEKRTRKRLTEEKKLRRGDGEKRREINIGEENPRRDKGGKIKGGEKGSKDQKEKIGDEGSGENKRAKNHRRAWLVRKKNKRKRQNLRVTIRGTKKTRKRKREYHKKSEMTH